MRQARVLAATAFALMCTWPGSLPLAAQKDVAFPPEVYAARRARLLEAVQGEPVIIAGNHLIRAENGKQDPDFFYLTGVESPYAILVLRREGGRTREWLFLPGQYQFAGAQYPLADARFRTATWNVADARLFPGPQAARRTGIAETLPLDEFARRLPAMAGDARRVWFLRDGAALYAPPGLPQPLSVRQQLEQGIRELLAGRTIEDARPLVARMRLIKDEHEIGALRRAAAISAEGLMAAMRAVRPGMNDLELAGLMEYEWKRRGSPHAAFAPIVMSGPAALSLYTIRAERYHSTDRVMQSGELVFVDYGAAEFDGYASDLCRTFPVAGRFSTEQRRWYDVVLAAQEAALARIRPGVMMIDVIRAAAQVFADHGLAANEDIARLGDGRVWGVMPSPTYWLLQNGALTDYSGARGTGVRDLGHHVGLEAIDSRDYSMPLAPGMVFTVEPKLYIPERGIAIMIEDMILVTRDGYENLSAGLARRADDIEALMRADRTTR